MSDHPHTPTTADTAAALEALKADVQAALSLAERRRLEREEVMAEIERLSAIVTDLMDGMEAAWGLLANGAYWDHTDPTRCEEWRQAMFRWRDERWHPALEAIHPEDNR